MIDLYLDSPNDFRLKLEKLSTKRLLSYLKKHRVAKEYPYSSDMEKIRKVFHSDRDALDWNKMEKEHELKMGIVRDILNKREHIE